MNAQSFHRLLAVLLIFIALASMSVVARADGAAPETSATAAGQTLPPLNLDNEQAMARGPIHEAYAQPVNYDAKPGIVVPKQPPQDVKEVPPKEKPDGDNVVWIPGYWGWDATKNDFIWISGLWRIPPEGRTWVPGYWGQNDNGWQWVSGYWRALDQEQTTYVPKPPTSLEDGPSSPSPGNDYAWVPGCWQYVNGDYEWSPGYWSRVRAGEVRIPSYYVCTPSGYVYVDGYWDYPLEMRGLLFAPVAYTQPIYLRPDYCYTPSVVVDCGYLTDNLFCYPDYGHYCFGDFYATSCLGFGIYPPFYLSHHRWYDEVHEHDRHHHGHDYGNWMHDKRDRYEHMRDNPGSRPKHDFAGGDKPHGPGGGDKPHGPGNGRLGDHGDIAKGAGHKVSDVLASNDFKSRFRDANALADKMHKLNPNGNRPIRPSFGNKPTVTASQPTHLGKTVTDPLSYKGKSTIDLRSKLGNTPFADKGKITANPGTKPARLGSDIRHDTGKNFASNVHMSDGSTLLNRKPLDLGLKDFTSARTREQRFKTDLGSASQFKNSYSPTTLSKSGSNSFSSMPSYRQPASQQFRSQSSGFGSNMSHMSMPRSQFHGNMPSFSRSGSNFSGGSSFSQSGGNFSNGGGFSHSFNSGGSHSLGGNMGGFSGGGSMGGFRMGGGGGYHR